MITWIVKQILSLALTKYLQRKWKEWFGDHDAD